MDCGGCGRSKCKKGIDQGTQQSNHVPDIFDCEVMFKETARSGGDGEGRNIVNAFGAQALSKTWWVSPFNFRLRHLQEARV